MDIKAELEALRDWHRKRANESSVQFARNKHNVFADELTHLIARLPPDAVVVPREPTPKMSWAAIKCHYDGHTTVEAMFRAMLQTAEEPQE